MCFACRRFYLQSLFISSSQAIGLKPWRATLGTVGKLMIWLKFGAILYFSSRTPVRIMFIWMPFLHLQPLSSHFPLRFFFVFPDELHTKLSFSWVAGFTPADGFGEATLHGAGGAWNKWTPTSWRTEPSSIHPFCHVTTEIITSLMGLFIKCFEYWSKPSISAFLISGQAEAQDERKMKLYIEEPLIEQFCI